MKLATINWRSFRSSRLLLTFIISGTLAFVLTAPALVGRPSLPFAGLVRLIFYFCGILLARRLILRGFRQYTWSLRNRLVAAYIFVAVVPVLLIAAMVALTLWLFYGQYAADLLAEEVRDHTAAAKLISAATADAFARSGRLAIGPGDLTPNVSQPAAAPYVRTYVYEDGRALTVGAPALPAWLKPEFAGLVVQPAGPSLVAYSKAQRATHIITVLAVVPLTQAAMDELAEPLGAIQVLHGPPPPGPEGRPRRGPPPGEPRIVDAGLPRNAGKLPPAAHIFDWAFNFPAFIPVFDWKNGESQLTVVSINSRPSVLNEQLLNTRDVHASIARWPLWLLGTVAVTLLVIELFSLVTGIRLTRTITRAVHDLYEGTRRINAGDFSHHVPVRTNDQLAALAASFNSMTDSITRLMQEQRQRQRLDSELAIAQEVQTQLFPRSMPRVRGVEVSGICIPARVVSGDYFDFIDLGDNRLAFALGDISGKGISAALLMATLASAIRAYQQVEVSPAAIAAGSERYLVTTEPEPLAPSVLVSRLNDQLYHSTAPEKYATLFYGVYDSNRHQLRYTNAGHLPPVIIGRGGRRRLTVGGMVIGLFDAVSYDETAITLEPGDLIAAWSDGVTEPENDYGEEFGEARLFAIIEENRQRSLEWISQTVLTRMREWNGENEQPDDVTLVLARIV